jgi:anti-sigma factor RsiW
VAEHLHLTCQEIVELATEFLEGALPAEQATLFEEHINLCDGCEWYLDQMRTTIAAVGRIEEEQLPPEMRSRLLETFRHWRRS